MKINLITVLTTITAFFLPIQPLILTVGLFIGADTVLGIYRAKKKNEPVTSRRLSNIVSKMVLYEGAVLLFFLLEKFILADFVMAFVAIPWFLTKIIAATLCLIEVKSMDESFTSIYGFSVWDKFKSYLKRSKELKDELQDFTSGKKENESKS